MTGPWPAALERLRRLVGPKKRAGALPPLFRGPRRRLLIRLIANGTVQAGAAIALGLLVGASAAMPPLLAAALLALIAGVLMALRMAELSDAERLGLDYVAQTRLALFDGLAEGRANTAHGVAMSRMMNDLSALRNWVGLGLARSVTAALALLGCVAAAALISPLAAVALGVPLVAVGGVSMALVRPLARRTGAVRSARGRLARLLGEALLALEMLMDFGQTRRMRRRIAERAEDLTAHLLARVRIAAVLRALPDAVLPGTAIAALALGLPLSADQVGLMLLAGIAAGPVRQALRALEYRAAFAVGRDRLSGALGRGTHGGGSRARRFRRPARPGLVLHPAEEPAPSGIRRGRSVVVRTEAPVLHGSLRRNIDITRRLRDEDERLVQIAQLCGLLDPGLAPEGLETRLNPDRPRLGAAGRARLALARALAAGAGAVRVEAPVLVLSAEGRQLLEALPALHGLRVEVWAGDAAGLFTQARGA